MSFHQRSHRAQVWDGGRGSGEEIQKGVMSPIPDINEEKGGTMGVLVYRRMAFRALRGHSVQSVVLKIYRETFHLVCFEDTHWQRDNLRNHDSSRIHKCINTKSD